MEFSFLCPAIIFTLLAIILMTALFNSNINASSPGSAGFKANHSLEGSFSQCRREEVKAVKSGLSVNLTESKWTAAGPTSVDNPAMGDTECLSVGKVMDPVARDRETVLQEEQNAAEVGTHAAHAEKECLTSNSASVPVDIPGTDVGHLHFPEEGTLQNPFFYQQTGGATKSSQDSTNIEEVDTDGGPLKYVPGMLRTSQMEKMMTKEELEEEQRVQREQLAAIFQLLKENQETFGEVSEGDVEEQLRLYNI